MLKILLLSNQGFLSYINFANQKLWRKETQFKNGPKFIRVVQFKKYQMASMEIVQYFTHK